MGWPRTVTVTVGGVDHTGEAIDSVYLQRGRRSYWEGMPAGLGRIILSDPAVRPAVNELCTVDVALQSGTARVFQGRVQAVSAQYDPNVGALITLDVFGPLARAGRRDQEATLPQQLDGARVLAVLEDALGQQWAEQPLTQQWGQVPASLTWADYGADASLIDAGLYTVAALTQVPTSTFGALAAAAFSGGGVVYETGDGRIGYADSTRRQGASLGTPVTIDASVIAARSGSATARRDDIVNQVILTWSGGTAIYNATDSIAEYGFTTREYTSILDDANDADDLAERLAQLQAFPQADLDGPFLVRLNNTTDSLTDQLLQLEINDYISVTNVPTSVLPAGTFYGFVEGLNIEVTDVAANVEVFASDERFSIYNTRWADVPDNLTWGDTNATLQWQNA